MTKKFHFIAALMLMLPLTVSAKTGETFLTSSPAPKSAAQAKSVNIDLSQRGKTTEGWGVSLCWWAHMCGKWDEAKVDSLVDWLVSPDGLNYNIFRYNIGGGDDPQNRNCDLHHMARGKGIRAEMPGFKMYADSPYDWEADSAQIKIMRKIHERRPDAIFEAFSNSAPWFMTVSGCCGGHDDKHKDNLKPECYADFAHYLVDVCKHIKDAYGIEFRTLDPFNEPMTDYWYRNGSQEGCHVDVASQVEIVKVLYPILKASGLKTVISASDETNVGHSIHALKGYKDIMGMVGQWNTHTYGGSREEKRELSRLAESLGIRLWQSESGDGGRGIDGNLKMLQRLFDDMRYLQPAAWCDWQYFGEYDTQWCLVSGDFPRQNYYRTKNYYVRQQVTRFIRQGYSILRVDDDQTLAALSPDGKTLVVVVLAPPADSKRRDADAKGKDADQKRDSDSAERKQVSINIIAKGMKLPRTAKLYTTSRNEDLVPSTTAIKNGKITLSLAPRSVQTVVVSEE